MSPTICCAIPIEPEFEERLRAAGDLRTVDGRAPRAELLEAVHEADGILLSPALNVDEAFLDAAPKLRVVSSVAVGYNAFDVDLLTRRGVALCNTPGVLNRAVADLTVAMILMLSRRLMEFEQYSRSGAWGRREPYPALAHEQAGFTLGVIGFGRIGREVTRRGQALGMRTCWYDVFEEAPADAPESPRRELDDLLRESDFVSIHTDLNPSSTHLIGERELGLMRETAYLINTARGPAVDQKALTHALQSGVIAGAALDVLEDEPPDPDDPIVTLPNIITFPHIGTATEETRKAMRGLAVENLIAVLSGEEPPACVNPSVLTR
jgi:lactate dehydrogenase-like 2-hydroxyacid dehydrogenase